MPAYRSSVTREGRTMAGARALWRATGMKDEDFSKPVIAVVNSFTHFNPGHVHLRQVGDDLKKAIDAAGGYACEFNTIAIDDGIAMGHGGMLYSLPSRDLIADSVEYMVNAHTADAMILVSNCDKITPGMLMAGMRLNIPCLLVSGGPMEAGRMTTADGTRKLDLINPMISAGDEKVEQETVDAMERSACPTCGSCSGMFTANSMNCLAEALGLALPGNGTTLATHTERKKLFDKAARTIVQITEDYYKNDNQKVLPRNFITRESFENAMRLDIAMGGSTNTVLHLLAIAHEAKVEFTMSDIDHLSRETPTLCKVAPSTEKYHIEDVSRAGGIYSILGELQRGGLLHSEAGTVHAPTIGEAIAREDIMSDSVSDEARQRCLSAPGMKRTTQPYSQSSTWKSLDDDRKAGCIRDIEHAYSRDGGLCVLYGNIAREGCVVKTAGVDESILVFEGPARIFNSQEEACDGILCKEVNSGDVVVIRYEGPRGGPGMQEMLYPTSYIKSRGLGAECALITDGRFSGGTSGLSIGHISPEAAEGGEIALLKDGDPIRIDIPNRILEVLVGEDELSARREQEENSKTPYKPQNRDRVVSESLRAYALHRTSAARGGVRDLDA